MTLNSRAELYEDSYRKANRFSFGNNWCDFLAYLTPQRIKIAQESLESFIGKDGSKNKTFIDIGCGSGLFSLAAFCSTQSVL